MTNAFAIARNLAEAGIEKTHAEAIAEAQEESIANALEKQHGEVATKDFVDAKINAVRSEINAAKFQIICWTVGTGLAIAALSVTILGLWIGGIGG